MKPISILFATMCALIWGGCADPLEQTTVQDVQEHFQRGVSDSAGAPVGLLAGSFGTNFPWPEMPR